MCDVKVINLNECYFVFPKFSLKSYTYSQFFYKLRKQVLGLSVRTFGTFSVFTIIPSNFSYFVDFFGYSRYFLVVEFYRGEFQSYVSWSGVYNSVFFSFFNFLYFSDAIICSPLFLFRGVNLLLFSKIFGSLYYFLLQFSYFFELKNYVSKF